MMGSKLISGNCHSDQRGFLFYNNDFDVSQVKRIYIVENKDIDFVRGWQGHQIEKRWFSAITGKFKIELIRVDNWENPSKKLEVNTFIISSGTLDVIYIPQGYISSIQSLEPHSKLLVMADYLLGEIKDEYRYDIDYFKI